MSKNRWIYKASNKQGGKVSVIGRWPANRPYIAWETNEESPGWLTNPRTMKLLADAIYKALGEYPEE